MKVLWISDYSIKHNKGGAQRSDDIIIKKGIELGHEISHFTHDGDLNLLTLKYDHIISSNLEAINSLYPVVTSWLSEQNNHSRLEHDKNSYLSPEARKALFSNCRNTFFLTEYHHSLFKDTYGDFFVNVKIVQDPIDTKTFRDKKGPREDKILNVGFMHFLKGSESFYNYVFKNPDKQFVVAGWGSPMYEHLARTASNVQFLGSIDHEKMPEVFNKYKTLFYHPIIEEPFCRSVGEAMLCGMELSINRNIGCAHEASRIGIQKFSENCKNADSIFWKSVFE